MSSVSETGNGGAVEMRGYQVLQQQMAELAEAQGDASFEISARVLDAIAMAETPEEVFAANESGPGDMEDWLGIPLGVREIRPWKSSEKFRAGTLGFYVALDIVTREGKEEMITVGAPNVVGGIFRLYKLGYLGNGQAPFWLIVKGRETGEGTLYTIHAAPAA
jgi:hypothetical protein